MKRRRGNDGFEIAFGGERLVVISLPARPLDRLEALTRAEREVAADAIAGLSNTQIARKRKRSERTVANQLASTYRKLGVASRAGLAASLARGSTK